MNSVKNEPKRLNRMKCQWSRFFTPFEYVLMDKLLFLSNHPTGFDLHIRFLAKDCRMSVGMASKLVAKWPFVKKVGTTKNMTITVDYVWAINFIVRAVNSQIADCSRHEQSATFYCSPHEPKSNVPENVHVPDVDVEDKSTDSTITEGGVEGGGEAGLDDEKRAERALPSAADGIQAAPPTSSDPIVHGVNNKKSPVYVVSPKEPEMLKLPHGIKNVASPVRHRAVVKMVNDKIGFHLRSDTEKGCRKDDFHVLAYDDNDKAILISADDERYIANKTTQAMCAHFKAKGYTVMAWLACDQTLYRIMKARP